MQTTRTLLRQSRAAVLVLTLVAGASTAQASHEEFYSPSTRWKNWGHDVARGNLVDVQVKVDRETAPLYFRPVTSDRHYFQAFKGRNYSLVVRNNTGRRVGVLIAVDGLNVVSGERSRQSRHEPMYVLDPYERAEIRGWRTSLDEVRRFVFVDEERSYAERTGQANGDMGWIRVTAFREVMPARWWNEWEGNELKQRDESGLDAPRARELRPAPEEAPRAKAESFETDDRRDLARGESLHGAPESNPGTGWGQRRRDPVRRTEFLAERTPSDRIVLRYEYASGLRALGIFPRRARLWERENGQLGFAKPPHR